MTLDDQNLGATRRGAKARPQLAPSGCTLRALTPSTRRLSTKVDGPQPPEIPDGWRAMTWVPLARLLHGTALA